MFRTWYRRWVSSIGRVAPRQRPTAAHRRSSRRLLLEALEDRLAPANHIWVGQVNSLWSVPGNWGLGGPPAGDPSPTLDFPPGSRQTSTDDLPGQTNIAGMTFDGNSNNYIISAVPGNSIRLSGDVTDNQNFFGDPPNSLTLPIALGGGQFVVSTMGFRLLVNGPLFDPSGSNGNLIKSGAGTVALAPQNGNTYSGATIINQGTLQVGNTNALPLSTAVFVNSGGVFDLDGNPTTIGGLGNNSGAGAVHLGNVTLTLAGNDLGFNGSIAGTGGRLTKIGPASMFLESGGSFTYSGPTTVQQGFLVVDGTLANSGVSVDAGAFLEGTGSIANMTISGTVNPGFGGFSGILNGGNAVFNAGSHFSVHLNGTTPGSGYSQLFLTGTANLSASPALNVALGFTPAIGTSFTILEALGGRTGTFNGLPEGTRFVVGSLEFQIHYTTTTVVLTRVTPGPAATLRISPAAPSVTAGVPFSVTVTALDQAGATATGYTGTVHFSSTDSQATVPANHTFTAADAGVHTFTNGVTLRTSGGRIVFVQDTVNPNLLVGANATVSPAAASHLSVTGVSSVTAGNSFTLTVRALDAFNNTASGYRGTVTFTSNDSQATLPVNYTFVAADNGVHTFTNGVTLRTAGSQTVTAADTVSSSITGSATVTVIPAAASQLVITQQPSATATAGQAFATQPVVKEEDAFGNVITSDSIHTVTAARGSHGTDVLHGTTTVTLASGVATFSGLFYDTAETMNISFSTNAGSFSATSNDVVVSPGAADHFLVIAPASSRAGSAFDISVTVQDAFNNTATGYAGTVHFTSQDPLGASLPTDYTFTPVDGGTHTFSSGATLFTAGSRDVTATDTSSGITGSASVLVTPAPAVQFVLTAPAQATSGVPFDLTVNAQDPFGNTDTNYQGTVTFTSSDTDPGVILPADYAFQSTDQGTVTFPGGVTLITPGGQTVAATDTTSGINGSAPVTVTGGGGSPRGSGNPQFPAARPVPLFGPSATPIRESVPLPLSLLDVGRLFAETKTAV